MQRLFSMFPQGAPGLGLLLLRFSVAIMLLTGLIKGFGEPLSFLLALFGLVISALLAIGFLTPIASTLACVSATTVLLAHFRWDNLILVFIIMNSASLALLGPGSYSLDARLFGRRVVVVSARKNSRRR